MKMTYKIVRFYRDRRPRQTIKCGLTLKQAQEHCRRDDTHTEDWFDGWTEEMGHPLNHLHGRDRADRAGHAGHGQSRRRSTRHDGGLVAGTPDCLSVGRGLD